MKHIIIAVVALLLPGALAAQSHGAPNGEASHVIVAIPGTFEFAPAPPSLPPGARLAVLEGDPSKEGAFTMQLWMPSGYRIPPHFHPADEHVTVLKGAFHVGMGEVFDADAATRLPTGTFAALSAGVRHYAFTEGETIIQLHGNGPWSLTYVNPADDPRR
ncbi:MAG: cupin domain-containing protein [Longimicrobiales bacterium]